MDIGNVVCILSTIILRLALTVHVTLFYALTLHLHYHLPYSAFMPT